MVRVQAKIDKDGQLTFALRSDNDSMHFLLAVWQVVEGFTSLPLGLRRTGISDQVMLTEHCTVYDHMNNSIYNFLCVKKAPQPNMSLG